MRAMFLLMFAAAAASPTFSAPIPIHRDTWISPAIDFPRRGINRNSYTAVTADLTVNPHGAVIGCQSWVVAGNPGMGPYTCTLLRQRALFKPARDASGRRVHGIDREAIVWSALEKAPPPGTGPSASRFKVTAPALPPATELPAEAQVQFAVDAAGTVGDCRPMPDDDKPALALVACGSLKSLGKVDPARDRKGIAVPSIQNARVEVTVAR